VLNEALGLRRIDPVALESATQHRTNTCPPNIWVRELGMSHGGIVPRESIPEVRTDLILEDTMARRELVQHLDKAPTPPARSESQRPVEIPQHHPPPRLPT
jgi:hypothetical protein